MVLSCSVTKVRILGCEHPLQALDKAVDSDVSYPAKR